MPREKRTPSRTDLEREAPEDIIEKKGALHYLQSLLKSQRTHDASRKLRRIERDSKNKDKKSSDDEDDED